MSSPLLEGGGFGGTAGVCEGAMGGLGGGFGRGFCDRVRAFIPEDSWCPGVHLIVTVESGCISSRRRMLNRNLNDEFWPATGSPLKIVLTEAELSEKKWNYLTNGCCKENCSARRDARAKPMNSAS